MTNWQEIKARHQHLSDDDPGMLNAKKRIKIAEQRYGGGDVLWLLDSNGPTDFEETDPETWPVHYNPATGSYGATAFVDPNSGEQLIRPHVSEAVEP